GSKGPQGPSGRDGRGEFRWVDADGVEVVPYSELVYWDDDGHAWNIGIESGEIVADSGPIYFVGGSCTGTAYSYDFRPRMPIRLEGEWYVRKADATASPVTVSSHLRDGTCSPTVLARPVVPLSGF